MFEIHMDDLSTEILQHVAGYLHDVHKPSLVSFSLASRSCHSAAKIWLFRRILLQVDVEKPAELQETAAKWVATLHRTQSQHHVRQVEIADRKHHGEDGVLRGVFISDRPFQPWNREKDQNWLPIANLIGLMSNVTDLVYMPTLTFPPCLLKVVHEQHPQCRLHIHGFRFKSLHEATIDPHELAIATSPCLHSVTIRHTFRDSFAIDDWNLEAQLRLVAGLAPNLKKVRSVLCRPGQTDRLRNSRSTPRQPCPDLFQGLGESSSGALESLSLLGSGVWAASVLDEWHKATDFSALRFLDLRNTRGSVLGWAAQNVSLPNLKGLRLFMNMDGGPGDYTSGYTAFFSMLPPLEVLDYAGNHEGVFDCILGKHGPSLRVLSLSTPLGLSEVRQLNRRCSCLDDLRITIKRSMSDETEVSTYRALGSIRHLTNLYLVLDCSQDLDMEYLEDLTPPQVQPCEGFVDDPFDWQPYRGEPRVWNGHVRYALLNSAVDEALARSIWDTIDEAKEGTPLQSLELHTTSSEQLGRDTYPVYVDLDHITRHIARSYRLDRSSETNVNGVTVIDLGLHAAQPSEMDMGPEESEDNSRSDPLLVIFRHIWPTKEGSVSWRDDWSSLPLRK